MDLIKNRKYIIILLAILSIACFFRLWELDSIPPGLYPDEAINGNQAITEFGKIFYPENNGREGLFINLIGLSFSIFGVSVLSFRLVPALIGTSTVLGLYLLTRELFSVYYNDENRSRIIALFSSFFLAVSFWHINFSRIGFRAILVPFVLTFSFYFLFKSIRTKKIWNIVLAGIIFGLGFHTYIAFRVAVLLLGIIFIFWYLVYKKQNLQKRMLAFSSLFLIFCFLTALPIVLFFLQNPDDFMGRASNVSIFTQPNKITALGESLVCHLVMFNFFGDYNWRHNISGFSVLFWPVGILFLIGLFISIKKCFVSLKNKNLPSAFNFWFLVSGFFIMLLPGILSYEGIPHSLRCIGAIPFVFIFAGIGGEFLFRIIKKIIENLKPTPHYKIIIFLLTLLMISFVSVQYSRYFFYWAKNPETKNSFSYNYVEIGRYLNSLSSLTQKYVIVNQDGVLVGGIPMPAQTIMFIENTKLYKKSQQKFDIKSVVEKQIIYLLPENINRIKTKERAIIVPMQYDERLFNQLQAIFPQGKIQKENGIFMFIK